MSATTSLLQSMTTGVLVLYALDTLEVGEAGFGLLLTASGVGAVAGGLVAAPLAAPAPCLPRRTAPPGTSR